MDAQASSDFVTVAKDHVAIGEYEDRRSRFIAQITGVSCEREAQQFVEQVRAQHRDARHNVPAWIMSDGREKCSDDGEPSHTAGIPTLEVLRSASLADVCCVVTRYFGGTLLGPGGLKRAYAAATQEALRMAEREQMLVKKTLVVRVVCVLPYSAYDYVRHLVEDCGGKIKDSVFAEDVQLTAAFRAGEEGRFVDALREYANGEDLCRVSDPVFGEL